jgi:uncharacterized protein
MRHALPQLKRTFDEESSFQELSGSGYSLLPFRFLALDDVRYVLSNFAGQHVVLDRSKLDEFVRHRLSKHDSLYDNLKARHFLLDDDSTIAVELLANQYRTKQQLLPQLTGLFIFVVSLRCEHSCPYCQVSRQSSDRKAFDMTVETAERAIEMLFSTPSPSVKVEFQGGEPLLNFELIKWIVEAVEAKNESHRKQVSFVIATNLAIVDEAILSFCGQHEISISTSLDGPAWLHNLNRPRPGGNSYELAVKGIEIAKSILGADQVSALMTTTAASLNVPEEIVDEYLAQGFYTIFLRPLSPFGFAVRTKAVDKYDAHDWLAFYERGLRYIISVNLRGTPLREEYAALLLRRVLTPFPTGYVDLQSPAGMGIGCLVFNYDGYIYGSDESRMLAESGVTKFRLGHIESASFNSIVTSDDFLEILASTMTEAVPMCSDCGFQPYCGSDPIYHFATQGDVVGNKAFSGFCSRNMGMLKLLFRILEDEPEAAKVLKSWI